MAGLLIMMCRNCLHPSKYHGITTDGNIWNFSYFLARRARTNRRIKNTVNATPKINQENGDKEQSTTNSSISDAVISLNKIGDKALSLNQSSESSGVDGIPPYVKLQDNDTLISKTMIYINSKKNRENRREILLEGNRLIADAIKFGVDPKVVFFSRVEDVKKIRWPTVNFKMYKVAYRTIKIWSTLTTSPGILGVFKKPDLKFIKGTENSLPLLIVCDNIRDPGNLGSILRVAAAVGSKCVLLTKGCVDLWDSKVLRSGAGAHFVLPIHTDCRWEEISEKFMDDESTIILADNHNFTSVSEMNNVETVTQFENDVPLKHYHMVDYSGAWEENSQIVIVLGGETEGLSEEAYKLAQSRGGVRLHIPLFNEVESLNASTALGVITFEIRRQYEEWSKNIEQIPVPHKNTV